MDAHIASLPKGGQTAIGSKWEAGDIMYADINGDGKIDNGSNTLDDMGDLKKIGNNTPRFRTGITLDAQWKGFDFSMFWQGVSINPGQALDSKKIKANAKSLYEEKVTRDAQKRRSKRMHLCGPLARWQTRRNALPKPSEKYTGPRFHGT